MKNNITRYAFILSLLLVFACDDTEFVTEDPQTFLTTDNVITSDAQVELLAVTLYQQDRQLFSNLDGVGITADGGNDRLTGQVMYGSGTDVFTVPGFRVNDNFADYSTIVTPFSSRLENIYAKLYEQISTANTLIFFAESEDIPFDSEEARASLIAQAKFFRGKAHGMATMFFGKVTIVEEPTTTARFDFEQFERSEIYQFAIDDLLAALPDLPETTTESGRIVKGAAQHYLSEFYLGLGIETGDNAAFTQSIEYASDVIDGGTYSLMQDRFGTRADEDGRNVYWDLFRVGNQNYAEGNFESIYTHQIDFDASFAGDEQSVLPYPRYFSPVWRAIEGVIGETETEGGRGVAFLRPTELVETTLWDASISDGDIRGEESNIRRTVYYNDPEFMDGSLLGEEVSAEDLAIANEGLEDAAYYPIYEKLTTDEFIGLDQGEDRSNIYRDRYVVRLPETILLRAEAYYRMGNSSAAAADINLIRTRAQCNVMATAGMVDLDFILDERARELFGEENRWATLLRMGGSVASDRIRENAWHDFTTSSLTFDFDVFPIPQGVIDRNSAVVWEQNEAWIGR